MATSTIGGRAARYGAYPLVALAATVMLETGERGSLSQAVDGIQSHFGVSDVWIGALPAAMTLVGVVASIPFGHLADHMRRTYLLAFAMAVWTVVMGLNALAPTFAFLFLTRVAIGIVEANGAASISLLSDYYPVRERAKRIGIYNSGALVGSALGLGLAGVLVDQWGWRAAFWMWIPFGVVTVLMLWRTPEPARGEQDADLAAYQANTTAAEPMGGVDATSVVDKLDLPPPTRVGHLDYATCTWREAYREIFSIRSMWFGVIGITVSSALLSAVGFWGVPFLKEVHDLSASAAGAYVIIFGLGAAVGVVSGGFLSDRLLRRGIVNARIYVVFVSSLLATAAFIPAFAATSLAVTLPLFLVGGLFLTLPVAPADAMVNDVVVPQLRGRASALRSVVRSVAGLMPFVIGILNSVIGLQAALIAVTPLYAVGGIIVLFAARTYPSDLAFVLAESNRRIDSDNMPAS